MRTNSVGKVAVWLIALIVGVVVVIGISVFVVVSSDDADDNETTQTTSDGNDSNSGLNTSQIDELAPTPYEDSEGEYSIRVPEGWEQNEISGIPIFGNPKPDQGPDGAFSSNINVVYESAPGVGLDEYLETNKESLQRAGFDVEETKKVTINERSAYLLTGSTTQAGTEIRNLQLYALGNSKAYVVTATALASAFDDNKTLFESSLSTFKLS